MNKIKKILPELRFPEFKDAGEWEEKKLGEILIKNSTKNKKQKYSLVQSVSNKFGLINQEEYFENRRIAGKDTSNYYVIKKGYFAYNPSRIDVGSLAYKYDNETSIISPLYVSFKADNKLVLDYFLLNWFDSENFTKQMIFEGGVRNTLNYESLIQIKILLPPSINEQQRIAACLSSLDELISTHSQKLELLKAHKKGLMQNLFPQEGKKEPELRFKEFEDSGEWEEKLLGDCLTQKPEYGINASAVPYSDKLPTYLRITDISEDGYFLTNNKMSVNMEVSEDNFLNEGDIVLARTGASVGKSYKYKKRDGELVFAGFLIRVRPNVKKLNADMLFHFLSTHQYWAWVSFISARSGQPGINGTEYSSMPIILPPKIEEQQKIASCLSSLDELITAQSKKIEQLKQHKKGLMQGLFPKINE